MDTPTEITYLHIVELIQKDIFQLQISMHHISFMHVGQGLSDLLENGCYLLIRKHFLGLLD